MPNKPTASKVNLWCRLLGHKYGHFNTIETEEGDFSHAECQRSGCDFVRKRIVPVFEVDEDVEITPEFLDSLEKEVMGIVREIARENPNIEIRFKGKLL